MRVLSVWFCSACRHLRSLLPLLAVRAGGLFYFNDAYRPVPLLQTFIGVTENNALRRVNQMNKVAYDKAMAAIRKGKQVMVFVHSRKDTAKTARALLEFARADNVLGLLSPFSLEEVEDVDAIPTLAAAAAVGGAARAPPGAAAATATASATGATTSAIKGEGRIALTERQWMTMQQEVDKSRNADVKELFPNGFGIHHAGMLRADRGLTERMFAAGVVKILVCTATLAWGVNLPAHTVSVLHVLCAGCGHRSCSSCNSPFMLAVRRLPSLCPAGHHQGHPDL